MQFALLDDASALPGAATSRLYQDPCAVLRCDAPAQLSGVLHQAQLYLAQGWYAVVLCYYELAGVLHHVLTHPSTDPLVEIQFYRTCQHLDAYAVTTFLDSINTVPGPAGISNIQASLDFAQFEQRLAQIQTYLAQGHSYQINLTYRLFFQTYGCPITLYRRLRQRQPVPYGALIKREQDWVLSYSPELFVRRTGAVLTAQPMKGTAPRSGRADLVEQQALATDEKNRVENVIIVDLLRNDLGRVSTPGSVIVPSLFDVQAHSTVWQMTSTVRAHCQPQLDLLTLLSALFPCGSVTGAPKRRSLEIIYQLESTPRRLYCGALGWIDPPTLSADTHAAQTPEVLGDFCFSVPIRTLLIDAQGKGELGIGAGITYGSDTAEEYAECQLKGKFLTGLTPEFALFETLALDEDGYMRLPMHLRRLENSARELGFAYSEKKVWACLLRGLNSLEKLTAGEKYRARLTLGVMGEPSLSLEPLLPLVLPVKLVYANKCTLSTDFFLRHKTTYRPMYDEAWRAAEQQGGFDALFCNELGQITEGGRSNVFVQIKGTWITPPLNCGVLPGVMRAELIKHLRAQEQILYRSDLLSAQSLLVCNSLRGPLLAKLDAQITV